MPPRTDDAIVAQALAEVRARIDDTDRKLLRLLDQRASSRCARAT
jgi:chorismate mutase